MTTKEELNVSFLRAVENGEIEKVRNFLDAGADIHARDENPWKSTALHNAARANKEDMVSMLLGSGADPNFKDATRQTALYDANSSAIVTLLLAAGADPNLKDSKNETAAQYQQRTKKNARQDGRVKILSLAEEPSGLWRLPSPERVMHEALDLPLKMIITEIFNFTTLQHTQIIRNLDTNAESHSMRHLSDLKNMNMVQEAYDQLVRLGGKVDPDVLMGIEKRKTVSLAALLKKDIP